MHSVGGSKQLIYRYTYQANINLNQLRLKKNYYYIIKQSMSMVATQVLYELILINTCLIKINFKIIEIRINMKYVTL